MKDVKLVQKFIIILMILSSVFMQFDFILNVKAINIGVKGENSENLDPTLIIDEGSITVTDVDSNDTFKAYKLLDAFYDESTNEISYNFTNDFNTFLKQSNNHNGLTVDDYFAKTSSYGGTYTTSTLDILVSEYTTYIRTNNIEGIDMITSGTSATVTVSSGAYLVLPEQTTNVYAVMVGNVVYEEQDGNWVLKNSTISAKKHGIVFMSFVTNLDAKYLLENINSQSDAYNFIYSQQVVTEDAFNIQEEYTNVICAEIYYPTNSINRKFSYEIEISEGITLNEEYGFLLKDEYESDLLVVKDSKIYKNEEQIGTIQVEGNKILIEMDNSFRSNDSNAWLYFVYRSSLNENSIIGKEGNNTNAKFTYASDPYDLNSSYTIESTTTVYTYGIKINNYGDEDKTIKLNGSVFEIYSDSNLSTKVGEVNITDGEGSLVGISDGTYYLKQKKSASGYKLLNDTMDFQVNSNSDYTTIDIVNIETGILPSTGGVGTVIYTIVGLIVMVLSTLTITNLRKKQLTT